MWRPRGAGAGAEEEAAAVRAPAEAAAGPSQDAPSHGPSIHSGRPVVAYPRGGAAYRGYRYGYGYGYPYRPYYYPYRPGFGFGFYTTFGYPYGYYGSPYRYGYPYAYPYAGYGYPVAPAEGYYGGGAVAAYGGVRIKGAPPRAQVFVDGYYVGVVDDFDGAFQQINLDAGAHELEIHIPGQPPSKYDVNVQPGLTMTIHAGFQ